MSIAHFSQTVQNYIKTIYALQYHQRPVSNSALRARLNISAAAVTDMVQTLEKLDVAGTVTLTEQTDGTVRAQAQVSGLPAGEHAMHFHQFGQCAPTFAAAGEHTNPLNLTHGLADPTGPHASDLPNVTIGADGTGRFDGVTDLVTISPSDTTLRDTDGTAVIIHALPDDGVTDPGGRSNGRLLCAIVQPITVPLPDTGVGMQGWALLSMAAAAAVAGGTVLRRAAQRS